MGGTPTNTTTTTSGSSNPDVNTALSGIAKGITGELGKPAYAYDKSLYVPSGTTTQQGQNMALSAAGNPLYSQGINSAMGYNNNLISRGGLTGNQSRLMGQYGDLGHAYDAQSPGVARLRSNLIDDTMTNVNGVFNNSGRFGGGTHSKSLGEGVGNALAGFDTNLYDKSVGNRYASLGAQTGLAQQGVQNTFGAQSALPGLFSAGQLPSSIYGAVGSAQDADARGIRQGDYDLQTRMKNADMNKLGQLGSIATGNAAASGQTQVNTSPGKPWWETAIGTAASIAPWFL